MHKDIDLSVLNRVYPLILINVAFVCKTKYVKNGLIIILNLLLHLDFKQVSMFFCHI